MNGDEEKIIEARAVDRKYQEEMTDILVHTKKGRALCWHMYKWFLEVPDELRPQLLQSFLVTYFWEKSSFEREVFELPSQELFELFEKNKMLYIDEINEIVFRNLPEDEFYKELNEYIFGKDEKTQNGRFWKFYACILDSLLPYYRVELEKAKDITEEDYLKCKAEIGHDIFLQIDSIVIEKLYDTTIKKAHAIYELIESGKTELERVVLMEEALRLLFYAAQHYSEVVAYQNNEKGLYLKSGDEIYQYFSHEFGPESIVLKEKNDLMSGKEAAMRIKNLGAYKCMKADRILHYVESGNYETYLQIAQILLDFIEREPDFLNRVTIFACAIEYCELLK